MRMVVTSACMCNEMLAWVACQTVKRRLRQEGSPVRDKDGSDDGDDSSSVSDSEGGGSWLALLTMSSVTHCPNALKQGPLLLLGDPRAAFSLI